MQLANAAALMSSLPLCSSPRRLAPLKKRSVAITKCVAGEGPSAVAAKCSIFAAPLLAAALMVLPASAAWDGESAAMGSCPLGEAGTECRMRILGKDGLGAYSSVRDNASKLSSGVASGVPVSDLGSVYAMDTASLGSDILTYANLDPYDENRPAIVKKIKAESASWVSKYARGGSVRKLSARRFYIAVDAVQGHLASNGFAPFPRAKVAKLVTDVTDAQQLIQEGK